MFYFYIFRCKDGTLYCGSTPDVRKREQLHNSGLGSKYVHSRGGGVVVYTETFPDKSSALKREIEVKKWTKKKKEDLLRKKA